MPRYMLCSTADPEELHGEIWKRRTEDGSVSDASSQARLAQERFGAQGEEPEAGYRDRIERSAKERRQGAVAEAHAFAKDIGLAFAKDIRVAFALAPDELIVSGQRNRVVRYAVVGLGHIAQVAVLPAFANASRNSRVTALVSNDATKLKTLARKYHIEHAYSYDQYEECLRHVDAVYIALPNSMHAEYTVRAARLGVHVLCEKPMAVTVGECEQMIEACRRNHVKLMIAYRLHFEDLNLKAIDLVHRGRIGKPKFFNSSFAMTVKPENIRTKSGLGGGTLYDIGVYCINAARYLFRAEPTEVMAISVNGGDAKLSEIDETTGAILRFEGERVAAFITSFNADDVASYRIVGTKGQVRLDPAYEYAEGLSYELTVNGKTTRERGRKHDQFSPELLYFSDCVVNNREPEPSGLEGLQDVRIVQALYRSAKTGRAVRLAPIKLPARPSGRQRIVKPPVKPPSPVKASSASQ
jgi:predicted dehydrogenase